MDNIFTILIPAIIVIAVLIIIMTGYVKAPCRQGVHYLGSP